MDSIALSIVVTCVFVNIACGTLGCFLVLRRLSLVGDAISHAVLPGLAIAFLVTQSRDALPMLIGAIAAGMFTVVITHVIQRYTRVPEDAALGVSFTSLFALGVIIITIAARQVDLDPGCVLYGNVEMAWLDTTPLLGLEVPRIALTTGVTAVLVLIFVAALWKELKLSSFDPNLSTTLGFSANLIHHLLMGMVAVVTVAAFEAVGSILVVAMLIVPAATAHLLTDRLGPMLVVTWTLAIALAFAGRAIAALPELRTSVAGTMAVCAGVAFAAAVVFAPRHGVLAKQVRRWRLQLRVLREDLLAILWRWDELGQREPITAQALVRLSGGRLGSRLALRLLAWRGEINLRDGHVTMAERVREHAASLVMRHRLWEVWLHERLGVKAEHVHPSADRMMHVLSDELAATISEDVGEPELDPHGKPLPKTSAESARRARPAPGA